MRRSAEKIEIAGEVRQETELAWRFFDGARFLWLAKSQCVWDPAEGTMLVPEWLAFERGLV